MNKFDRYKFYQSREWKELRELALIRDNYECVMCKAQGRVTTNKERKLDVDHIISIEERPDLRLDLDNLQVLCVPHHNQKENRFNHKPNKWKLTERW